jgi:pyruvate/2-oxoglutarate dehydrogenase complex dihydrolipoamide acyltransferase (E2) component
MHLSASFDHCIINGAEVANFMNILKELFEDPGGLWGT